MGRDFSVNIYYFRGGTMAGPLGRNMTGMAYDSGKQTTHEKFFENPIYLDKNKHFSQTCGILTNSDLLSFILIPILSIVSMTVSHFSTNKYLSRYDDIKIKYMLMKTKKNPNLEPHTFYLNLPYLS